MTNITRRTLGASAVATLAATVLPAAAANALKVYGPGGPQPAMKEAAAVFGKLRGVTVEVTAGPLPKWQAQAKMDADLVFSGSEVMMSDFFAALPDLDASTVRPLYLRPSAILVRPGNPKKIAGLEGYGLTIVGREPIQIAPTAYNAHYMETKREKMGHMFGAPSPVAAEVGAE